MSLETSQLYVKSKKYVMFELTYFVFIAGQIAFVLWPRRRSKFDAAIGHDVVEFGVVFLRRATVCRRMVGIATEGTSLTTRIVGTARVVHFARIRTFHRVYFLEIQRKPRKIQKNVKYFGSICRLDFTLKVHS